MLKQRIITALVLLPIALGGFFLLDGLAFALFIGAVVSLGAWEWARLAGFESQGLRVAYAAVVALLLAVLYLLPGLAPLILALAVLWWVAATWLVLGYPDSSRYWGGLPGRLLIGLLILLPAWQGLVLLKQWPQANGLIIAVMLLVWGPISARISPARPSASASWRRGSALARAGKVSTVVSLPAC